MALRIFPVAAARVDFASAFGSHRGIDIFAMQGSPILAVDAGTVRASLDPKGGQVAFLATEDGTTYYYAHLESYVGTFPRAVTAGEQIATLGTTGNAAGKAPHLHFEVHPGGGDAIDPFPLLAALQPSGSSSPGPSSPSSSARTSEAGGLLLALLALLLLGRGRGRR